jgi:hypothetical protein
MREARSSFCEQKEAKKLSIHWRFRTLRPSAVPRRTGFFGSFFAKKELLPLAAL